MKDSEASSGIKAHPQALCIMSPGRASCSGFARYRDGQGRRPSRLSQGPSRSGPALLWNDDRTAPQCREVTSAVGLAGLRRTVGNLALEGFTAPKVLWSE